MSKLKFIAPSWDEIYSKVINLSLMIRKSSLKFDSIVGIARGGWIVARLLSDLLDIADIGSLRVEFYRDVGVHDRIPVITQPVSIDVRGKNILAVDDVSDTGSSLVTAVRHLLDAGASNVTVATIHVKPWSIFIPDFYVEITDAWIIYPWESHESIKSLTLRWIKEGLNFSDIRSKLIDIGIKSEIVDSLLPIVLMEIGELKYGVNKR
ncbi:MAG: phosphoribosyltransferase [Candidatus Methanomethylicia archaeon]|nr:phosphoribosyltransferase [Candidatus Methanomethylicia archaeon]MCX8168931.1 phosphoribosyltransferase [Candidatus Methanomethylicia archaeon]MDW7988663.1 phosphoribosyltransferase [Nitrososphaerota archaeon]